MRALVTVIVLSQTVQASNEGFYRIFEVITTFHIKSTFQTARIIEESCSFCRLCQFLTKFVSVFTNGFTVGNCQMCLSPVIEKR